MKPVLKAAISAEFQDWFRQSKVVDRSGLPRIVYHGTTADFDEFDLSLLCTNTRHVKASLGFYFSADPGVCDMFNEKWDMTCYPYKQTFMTGANTMPVYLSLQNPLILPAEQFMHMHERFDLGGASIEHAREVLIDRGHDGILIPGDEDISERLGGGEWRADTFIAFRPEQIKSVFNPGSFDPENPSFIDLPRQVAQRERSIPL